MMEWIALGVAIVLAVAVFGFLVLDFSDSQASVKVLEVGKKYFFLTFGEQHYVEVYNAYSGPEDSWEACIDSIDYNSFLAAKNSQKVVDIKIKGLGISNKTVCLTGKKASLIVDQNIVDQNIIDTNVLDTNSEDTNS